MPVLNVGKDKPEPIVEACGDADLGVTARSVKNCPLSVVGEVGGDDT